MKCPSSYLALETHSKGKEAAVGDEGIDDRAMITKRRTIINQLGDMGVGDEVDGWSMGNLKSKVVRKPSDPAEKDKIGGTEQF